MYFTAFSIYIYSVLYMHLIFIHILKGLSKKERKNLLSNQFLTHSFHSLFFQLHAPQKNTFFFLPYSVFIYWGLVFEWMTSWMHYVIFSLNKYVMFWNDIYIMYYVCMFVHKSELSILFYGTGEICDKNGTTRSKLFSLTH